MSRLSDYPNPLKTMLSTIDVPGILGQKKREVLLEEIASFASKRPQAAFNLPSRVLGPFPQNHFRIDSRELVFQDGLSGTLRLLSYQKTESRPAGEVCTFPGLSCGYQQWGLEE